MLKDWQTRAAESTCLHPAGSTQRIEVYRMRAELGLPIFRADDLPILDDPESENRYWSVRRLILQDSVHEDAPESTLATVVDI